MKIERIIFPDDPQANYRYLQIDGQFCKGVPKKARRTKFIKSQFIGTNIKIENDVDFYELTKSDKMFLRGKGVDRQNLSNNFITEAA